MPPFVIDFNEMAILPSYSLPLLLFVAVTQRIHGFSTPTPNVKSFHIGAGCFWEPADKLRDVDGIVSTTVGYCGDDEPFASLPSYETVCSGRTKLVEAVRVEYDSNQLSYSDMLSLFSEVNTAQSGNKRQYQGIIFTSSKDEAAQANDFVLNDDSAIATVEPMSSVFYSAEGYHQNYWVKWRTRVVAIILTIVLVGYFDNTEVIASEVSQQVWNYICYGLIGFSLLERRIDSKKEKIVVGQIED